MRRALAVSRSLARIRIPYSRITGALLSGAANAALDRTREARAAFEEAERRAREHGFRLHEAVARLRRAEQGDAAEGEALRQLEVEGVRDPWAAAYVLAPAVRRPPRPREHGGGADASIDAHSKAG